MTAQLEKVWLVWKDCHLILTVTAGGGVLIWACFQPKDLNICRH